MNVFGSTRSTVQRNHALICPDSFVPSPLPGWERTQGVILVKAGLAAKGLPAGPVRSPLVDATGDELAQLRADCAAAGLPLPE